MDSFLTFKKKKKSVPFFGTGLTVSLLTNTANERNNARGLVCKRLGYYVRTNLRHLALVRLIFQNVNSTKKKPKKHSIYVEPVIKNFDAITGKQRTNKIIYPLL